MKKREWVVSFHGKIVVTAPDSETAWDVAVDRLPSETEIEEIEYAGEPEKQD